MEVIGTIESARDFRRRLGDASLGFVPTMGYLHEGHLELVRRARAENDFVAVSIYVNPTQFGPTEDLSRYPRDLERDLSLLQSEGVTFVFTPDDQMMYPPGHHTRVVVSEVTQPLEGARRPHHFDGVATIVAKLFNIIRPTRAYFGQKDAQQTVVIRQMVRDLDLDLDLIICPTIRENDGLAMSSRNKYLSPEHRRAATILYRSLCAAENRWINGERDGQALRTAMLGLVGEPLAQVDYVSAADPVTLAEYDGDIPPANGEPFSSLAVFMGNTRLIDNFLLTGQNEDAGG